MLPSPLSFGDTVYCRVRGNTLIPLKYDTWDAELAFELIGYDPMVSIYILLCPRYYSIKGSWTITLEQINANIGLDAKYKGKEAVSVTNSKVIRIESNQTNEDGMMCVKCNKFIYMAGPNQDDGSFMCYACRHNPYR